MIADSLLNDFCREVNRNRSALLHKDFRSTWGFLGLNPSLLHNDQIDTCSRWYRSVFQYSFLNEIIINNPQDEIHLHLHTDLNDEDLLYALENISIKNGKTWNTATPYLSTKIESCGESFRLTLIHPHITSGSRPKAFLRRLKSKAIPIENYTSSHLLRKLISAKKNIVISGSTGSGKTTLAQGLLSLCPKHEHLVILEDTHEIYLKEKNVTQFLSGDNNSLVDYCSYALRISPDRLVLGELRGEEILPLILAMNTGHSGFMTTVHANSAAGALNRLKTLLDFYAPKNSSCFQMICQNIDIVIHMENKKIIEIIEVKGMDERTPLFEYLFRSEKEQVDEVL